MVHQLVESLIASGVNESALGVISPYRSQLKIIHHLLKHRTNLAIHTVDKFQGSDKECVVISLVRSNPKQNLGDLIRDWRRINVSFTRAKKKLVIFGSRSTLEGTALFAEFLNIIDEKAWELKLPIGAHDMHIIPPADDTPSAIVKQTDSVNIETGRHSIDKKQATVTRLKTKTATMHTKKTRQSVLGNNIAGAIA
ncbi:AAA domain-containing protein [Fimicolochytrium jonesii]|uniref:AAA domain-containing protein n=1 Tax=Fimicolochytrium jonesii TaxID=1396493 RepID=UPI0022FE801D|nr:AAA domain-containing protein [Fimicolochytrium jonesii]KAI8816488.1 AAA domain-containing protein [Fimicolochytrium jonesii]